MGIKIRDGPGQTLLKKSVDLSRCKGFKLPTVSDWPETGLRSPWDNMKPVSG